MSARSIIEAVHGTYPDSYSRPAANREAITAAAVRMPDGEIFIGEVHQDAVDLARAAGYRDTAFHGAQHGFYTSLNRFVDRTEAAQVARLSRQSADVKGELHAVHVGGYDYTVMP